MRIRIFQIDPARDEFGVKYEDSAAAREITGGPTDSAIYREAFSGSVEAETLEDIFIEFNQNRPSGHYGHSLSVSDVVQIVDTDSDRAKPGFHYAEKTGFSEIDFDPSRCSLAEGLLKTVCILPGRPAFATEIADDFRAMQNEVAGFIEFTYPFAENVCILSNDEGKLIGMEGTRRIGGDVYVGPLFILGYSKDGESLSLTDGQTEKYLSLFKEPEAITREEVESRSHFTIFSFS